MSLAKPSDKRLNFTKPDFSKVAARDRAVLEPVQILCRLSFYIQTFVTQKLVTNMYQPALCTSYGIIAL
jgi:hypothetical protein